MKNQVLLCLIEYMINYWSMDKMVLSLEVLGLALSSIKMSNNVILLVTPDVYNISLTPLIQAKNLYLRNACS